MGKRKFFKPGIWIAATATSAVLMTGLLVGGGFADRYAAQINSFFNTKEYELVKDPNSKEDTNYYKPKFATTDSEGNIVADKDKQYEYDKEKAREVNNEGAVLLWNNEKALPITSKNTKINLFGGRSANYYFVTDGSGGVRMSERPTLKEAFEQQGYTINSKLWDFYASHSYAGGTTSINETEYAAIDQSTLDSISGVGIYILSRKGSEGCDLYQKSTDGKNGSLTELSKQEIDTLNGMVSLKKQGKLDKAVVLLNTVSGGLQFSELSKFKNDIDACMWVGLGGTSGPNSVVDLVSGEANPSGRLSDTFVYDSFSAPATVNFSDFNYSNTESFSSDPIYQKLLRSQGNTDSTEKNLKYLVYQEGIYVGYKYYETRYEDCVLNRYNASSNAGVNNGYSSWNYDEQVAYPFGYGLSYTTFGYSDYKVDKTSNGYKVSIKVTNTGDVEGKDAVQIYLQKPYTDYDKENGIEQPAVNLIGFDKTDYLEPNESQLLSIDIDFNDFYTYDANNKQTYILEGGDYYLAFGDNAHSATNNILAAKGKVDGSVGDSSFAHKISQAQDLDGYKNPYGEGKVRNQFDDVDPNKADYVGNFFKTYWNEQLDPNANPPRQIGNQAKMVETDDLSFKEINDMLTILASGNLDKMNGRAEKINGTATQDELNVAYAAFEETFLQASVSVESTMNHRGLVTVKDKTTSVTNIKIAMYQDHGDKDYPADVGTENTKSASVLSFNKNDAVIIDRPSIDLFADLDDMIEAVFNGDFYGNANGVNPRTSGVQGAIKRLDHIMDHVNKIHAIAGTNSRHITDTNERATTLYLNVAEVKSTVIDADYGELAMQFQNNLLAYQAMLQATSKINQISLLNYM